MTGATRTGGATRLIWIVVGLGLVLAPLGLEVADDPLVRPDGD